MRGRQPTVGKDTAADKVAEESQLELPEQPLQRASGREQQRSDAYFSGEKVQALDSVNVSRGNSDVPFDTASRLELPLGKLQDLAQLTTQPREDIVRIAGIPYREDYRVHPVMPSATIASQRFVALP